MTTMMMSCLLFSSSPSPHPYSAVVDSLESQLQYWRFCTETNYFLQEDTWSSKYNKRNEREVVHWSAGPFVQPGSCFPLQASPRHREYLGAAISGKLLRRPHFQVTCDLRSEGSGQKKNKSMVLWMRLRRGFSRWQSIRQRRAASGIQTRVNDGSDGEREARWCICWAREPFKKHKWCKIEGGNSLTFSLLPGWLAGCSERVRAEEWMAFLVSLPPSARAPTLPPSIHRSADATLVHRGRRTHPFRELFFCCFFKPGVSVTEGFFSLAVMSSGCLRQDEDFVIFLFGPSVSLIH